MEYMVVPVFYCIGNPYTVKASKQACQDAQLAEKKFMLCIPLARESVRRAHTLFLVRQTHILIRLHQKTLSLYFLWILFPCSQRTLSL